MAPKARFLAEELGRDEQGQQFQPASFREIASHFTARGLQNGNHRRDGQEAWKKGEQTHVCTD